MNWDYLAGFFDGEGCLKFHANRKVYRADISQLDVGVLEVIRDFLLENKIYCKLYADGHYYKKNCKRLQINGFDDLLRFISFMKNRVIVKKSKFDDAFKLMNNYKPTHTWSRPWVHDEVEQMMRKQIPYREIMNKFHIGETVLLRIRKERNIPKYNRPYAKWA